MNRLARFFLFGRLTKSSAYRQRVEALQKQARAEALQRINTDAMPLFSEAVLAGDMAATEWPKPDDKEPAT
jgi:hypothetical protein